MKRFYEKVSMLALPFFESISRCIELFVMINQITISDDVLAAFPLFKKRYGDDRYMVECISKTAKSPNLR